MKGLFSILALILSLSACATNPLPENYQGPVATIRDTATHQTSTSADFFYLAKVDGSAINDSMAATNMANYGQGARLTPVTLETKIPVKEATFSIIGRTHYGAPILELTHTIYQIRGEVRFAPEQGGKYVVRGDLRPEYSAIWIEDEKTRTVIGKKIEIQGSTALGFFEK